MHSVMSLQWKVTAMQPHVHISPIAILASVTATVAIVGTLHLLALANGDNRAARAWVALGF